MAHVPVYSNATITTSSLSSGSGLTYASGTATWTANTNALTSGKMKLVGEDADLEINGKSLKQTLQALEERLNILVPNPELEKEWDQLKELGDQYRKLERELTEKHAMWAALKAEDR